MTTAATTMTTTSPQPPRQQQQQQRQRRQLEPEEDCRMQKMAQAKAIQGKRQFSVLARQSIAVVSNRRGGRSSLVENAGQNERAVLQRILLKKQTEARQLRQSQAFQAQRLSCMEQQAYDPLGRNSSIMETPPTTTTTGSIPNRNHHHHHHPKSPLQQPLAAQYYRPPPTMPTTTPTPTTTSTGRNQQAYDPLGRNSSIMETPPITNRKATNSQQPTPASYTAERLSVMEQQSCDPLGRNSSIMDAPPPSSTSRVMPSPLSQPLTSHLERLSCMEQQAYDPLGRNSSIMDTLPNNNNNNKPHHHPDPPGILDYCDFQPRISDGSVGLHSLLENSHTNGPQDGSSSSGGCEWNDSHSSTPNSLWNTSLPGDYRLSTVLFRFSTVDMSEQRRLLGEDSVGSGSNNSNHPIRMSDADIRMSKIDLEEQRRLLEEAEAAAAAANPPPLLECITEEIVAKEGEPCSFVQDQDDANNNNNNDDGDNANNNNNNDDDDDDEDKDVFVEVAPGLKFPIARISVTKRAALEGNITVLNCINCDDEFFCSAEAALVVCAECWTFNPVQQPLTVDLRELPKRQQFIDVGVKPDVILQALQEEEEEG